jgi:small nuclear ribonucleoprotein (snRNP)-like protein
VRLTVQLVELKNGEAYNGKMDSCDTWMNIHLKEVICTSKDGESFWRMKEVFIRGNTIKYIRVPDDTLGKAVEDKPRKTGATRRLKASDTARLIGKLDCNSFKLLIVMGTCANGSAILRRGAAAAR